ncbi:MAG: hypothetical protein HC806_05095 [Anaerolineae bacterium]|nr:hypothetical protein [Anaerolineae bacterium]
MDVAINERGYLRLSTPEWWVRHMGNTLTAEVGGRKRLSAVPRSKWLRGPLRAMVQWVYHKAFDLLYKP